MIIRKVDIQGDWTFGKGFANYAKDEEAIDQNIKSRVLSWMYNCFFALQEGIDYTSLMDKGQEENLTLAIRIQILQSYGVIGIDTVTTNYDSALRKLTVTYKVDTIFGTSFTSNVSQ